MMIRWWEHSDKDVKDGQADGRTEPFIELLGRSWKTVYCGCLALFLKQAPHINWKLYMNSKPQQQQRLTN